MQATSHPIRRLPAPVTAVTSSTIIAVKNSLAPRPTRRPHRVGPLALKVCMAVCVVQGVGCNYLTATVISPTSLAWASVAVGGKGAQKVATLTNNGTAAMTISSIAISGANPGDFTIFSKTCGTSLAAAASCTANIVFGPTVAGARSATLGFTDTGTGSPQTVALSGTGTGASTGTAAAAPSAISWVSVAVGAGGSPKAATLTNSATTAITIGSVTLSGANPGDYKISSKTCGTTLAASASCTATIVFSPTTTGTRTATLNFTDTASNSPQTVALSGTGTGTTGGTVSASPTTLSFGSTAPGATSPAQSATLSNGTTAAITISSVAISGTNAAVFAISTKTCGASLAAAASCSASLVFKPTAAGSFTATHAFTTSAGTKSVALSGSSATASAFSIRPMNPTVVVNEALQFSATANVSWSASCGTIAITSGLYNAPSTAGTCTVTATEVSSPHATVSTSVKVTASPASGTLGVYPTSAAVVAGSVQIFQAQLSTVPDGHSLTYSIDGVVGGNSTAGTITNEGVYTAPGAAGTHSLTVRDNSLGTTATATILVFKSVAVDFASRSASLHAVPAHFFGAERMVSMHSTADLDFVEAAGFNYARFYALTPIVFKTSTPDWAPIDSVVRKISAGGVHIMLQMYQTPPWLQPASNPCGTGAEPTNLASWGAMAAQYVKHMDATFPGVVTDYEIWNEPNTTAFCGVPAASKLTEYMKLYRAAVPLMRAQAKTDGSTARVGGPATAGMQTTWVNAMLADPTISQNIDFMSYHDYMFNNLQLGAQWDTYNGTMSVYQKTQNTGAGPLDVYLHASQLVTAGKQPQGKNLPIYNSEYNLDWDYAKNCCANDFIYSPVWNGMYIAGVLNSVYAGAVNTPQHMVYFAATAHPYFCLVGEIDTNMDCTYLAGSAPQAYPQYFLYQLFGSPSYLGLQNGGHMANSISPGIKGNGLAVTAFYTANLDAVVLINPNQDTYSNMTVNIANTGLTAPVATLYQIVDGRSIQTSSLSLQSQGGTSYSAVVTLGPYSVQAISIHH